MHQKKKTGLWPVRFLSNVILLGFLCGFYLSDHYPADSAAAAAFGCPESALRQPLPDGTVAYVPEEPAAGLIFYPGGKVDHTAYEPLMLACAQRGILCVLVEMPLQLAVLDIHGAEGIRDNFPNVQSWYMAGHSLGGSMAASHLAGTEEPFAGLILLAAYSTADLSDRDLEVLSVLASEDGILNREKYSRYRNNLPANTTELLIEGGCHAYFGMYGNQEGDGTPTISGEEQIRITADAIGTHILG